jgi:HNH endonuclease
MPQIFIQDPDLPEGFSISLKRRFWAKVQKMPGCWLWKARTRKGYGSINQGRRNTPIAAHKVSWILHNGEVPDGLCVLHHCDNRPCTNPAHLFLGTKKDNTADMIKKGRSRLGQPQIGEHNGRARLTWKKVEEMRQWRAADRPTIKTIAVHYGMSMSAVHSVLKGDHWKS